MTRFRGCIDIHAGQVKQIVGASLKEDDILKATNETSTNKTNTNTTTNTNKTKENFVSTKPSSFYAELYKNHNIYGCHVIKLGTNPENDKAAKLACQTWPYHLQVGGGINDTNALVWLDDYKASHVILTSWLFKDLQFDWSRLELISNKVGKSRLVVDLSCRQVLGPNGTKWVVAMNKWQTLTEVELGPEFLQLVSRYCDEFLVHAADVEGLCNGVDEELVERLGRWCPEGFAGKIVYAGGAKLKDDLATVRRLSEGKVDLTYGSSLDIFGGKLSFEEVVKV